MMLFLWVKILHVISACVLFGTGLGTAFYMFNANLQKDIRLIAYATKQVVFADWIFTGISGLFQFLSGMLLIYLHHYSFSLFWVWASILGYLIAAFFWFPVVYLQIQCRNLAFEALRNNSPLPKRYYLCYRIWWILGIAAFVSLISVFYLMTNKPV